MDDRNEAPRKTLTVGFLLAVLTLLLARIAVG